MNQLLSTTFLQTNGTYIVGLSGGPDSVALLHALVQLQHTYNLRLIAAHLNHEWRSDASEDVEFCKHLCKTLNVPFEYTTASENRSVIKHNGSQEAAGRLMRRNYFEQLHKQHNADGIILGHHQDDQHETFFIRLIRGTTLDGLACMKEQDGIYLRPLLTCTKQEILSYINEHNLSFLHDITNESDAYLRNRIRKTVMPCLYETDDRAYDNLSRLIKNIQEEQEYIKKVLAEKQKLYTTEKGLNCKKLKTAPPFEQKQIVKQWALDGALPCTLTEALLKEMIRFLCSERGGVHQVHRKWSIEKKEGYATIHTL